MMFLLPKNMETSEKTDWRFNIKVGIVFVIAVTSALLASYLPEQPMNNWQPKTTKGQDAFFVILQIAECIFWGIGVCFLVFVGPTLTKIAPTIKLKVIGMYICVGWILISWFPHIRLHSYFHDTWSIIALDISFHWTVAFATMFLSRFIFNFLIKVSGYSSKAKFFSTRFYRNDIFQALVIVAVSFVILMAGLQQQFHPTGPPPTKTQEIILIIIGIVEALLFGVANALLYTMSFVIHKIKSSTIKYRSIPVVVGIWWITASWWFHSRIHSVLPGMFGATDPVKYILVEVFFHWTSILSAFLIGYNIYGLIRMALNASKSPWRNNSAADTMQSRTSQISGRDIAKSGNESKSENESNIDIELQNASATEIIEA